MPLVYTALRGTPGEVVELQTTTSNTQLALVEDLPPPVVPAFAPPVNVDKSANAEGVAATFARSDHKHDVSTAAPVAGGVVAGGAAAEGTATTLARSDHVHAVATAAPVNVDKSANAAGVAATFARSDHKHDVSTAAPVATGTANAEGTATTLARSDHVHATALPQRASVDTDGTLNTTSAAFVNAQTLGITPPTAGDYVIVWYAEFFDNTIGASINLRVQLDGVDICAQRFGFDVDVLDNMILSGFAIRNLTAALHTINIDIQSNGVAQASIRRRRITCARVS